MNACLCQRTNKRDLHKHEDLTYKIQHATQSQLAMETRIVSGAIDWHTGRGASTAKGTVQIKNIIEVAKKV